MFLRSTLWVGLYLFEFLKGGLDELLLLFKAMLIEVGEHGTFALPVGIRNAAIVCCVNPGLQKFLTCLDELSILMQHKSGWYPCGRTGEPLG